MLQIDSKFGHQVMSLALLGSKVATLPWNALLALSVSIEFVSSSARVTSINSAKGLLVSDKNKHFDFDAHLASIPC